MRLFSWPKAAAFGRAIPKRRIYEQVKANTALKELFVQEVEQIVWAYKLAPETINLPAAPAVSEIQVLQLTQKAANLDARVLQAIDRAIPFPLIFELCFGSKVRLAAAYKRPNEVDGQRWIVGGYFESDWLPEDSQRSPLPVVLDLAALYEQLLTPLVDSSGLPPTTALQATGVQESAATYSCNAALEPTALSLEQRIELAETITAKQKEIERISSRLGREKQFNKRIAINAELRDAKQELQRLQAKKAFA